MGRLLIAVVGLQLFEVELGAAQHVAAGDDFEDDPERGIFQHLVQRRGRHQAPVGDFEGGTIWRDAWHLKTVVVQAQRGASRSDRGGATAAIETEEVVDRAHQIHPADFERNITP